MNTKQYVICSTVLVTACLWGVEPKVNKQHCAHSISDSTWLLVPFNIRRVSGVLSLFPTSDSVSLQIIGSTGF